MITKNHVEIFQYIQETVYEISDNKLILNYIVNLIDKCTGQTFENDLNYGDNRYFSLVLC